MTRNVDDDVVEGFGDEWSRFDQSPLAPEELEAMFAAYFAIFPWHALPPKAVGMDIGCGSGRWARLVAPRVAHLHCVDPSQGALGVARKNLAELTNVSFHHADAGSIPLADASMDFGFSLGVLHHAPDTAEALRGIVPKLKPGAPFLLYLYYAFDNRPPWFRALWRASDLVRRSVANMPAAARHAITDAIAVGVYWPLSRIARAAELAGADVDGFPLSYYRTRSLYVLRNDALDRFGTKIEHRFTRAEMKAMMESAGLRDVRFSDAAPYWCAVGVR